LLFCRGDALLQVPHLNVERLYTIAQIAQLGGPCRAKLYVDIKAGRLKAKKFGRSRLLVREMMIGRRGDASARRATARDALIEAAQEILETVGLPALSLRRSPW
jgi:hypothetical protein